MVNYQNLDSIKEYLSSLERNSISNEFESIIFNNFTIYISAGKEALSYPTIDYNKLSKFSHLQLFIYDNVPNTDIFSSAICPYTDVRFSQFEWVKYFSSVSFYTKKIVGNYAGNWIPFNEICKIIKDIYKVSRFRIFT